MPKHPQPITHRPRRGWLLALPLLLACDDSGDSNNLPEQTKRMSDLSAEESASLCDYIHDHTRGDADLMRGPCTSSALDISTADPSLDCIELRDACVEGAADFAYPCWFESKSECMDTLVKDHLDCLQAFIDDLHADYAQVRCGQPETQVVETDDERWRQLRDEAPGCQALRASCPSFFEAKAP